MPAGVAKCGNSDIRGQRTRSGEGSTSLGRRETFREARRRLPCLTIKGLGLRTRLAYGGRVVFWLHRRDSRTHLHAMRAVHATCNRDRPPPAAREHTDEMASYGYFSHNSLDGSSFATRIK